MDPTHAWVAVSQVLPVAQSSALVHDVLQPVAPHAYVPHVTVVGGAHAPFASHIRALIEVRSMQVAVLQTTPTCDPTNAAQAFRTFPSQTVAEQLLLGSGVAHAPRAPCGAPVTGVQVPFATSHASHCPVQAVSQHTPSAQWPLVHASMLGHTSPFARVFSHMPALHHPSAAQSLVVTQLIVQAPLVQRNGSQSTPPAFVAHAPEPLQSNPLTTVPAHTLAPHDVVGA